MIWIFSEYAFQNGFALLLLAESESGLCFEDTRCEKLGLLQIIIAEQHRRQGRGEVVDFRIRFRERPGVGEHICKK